VIAHPLPLIRTLIAAAVLASAASAQATDLYTGTLTLTASSPSQLGRLSRSGVPSDWSVVKTFPGVINPALQYAYTTLTLDLASIAASQGLVYAPFIQISIDSTSPNTFFSGYSNTYDPLNQATNYLGDAGASSNPFPGSPRFFQLVVPSTQKLVLVMNESTTGLGLNAPASILVEAFADTLYTNLSAVPEPATGAMLALGIATLAAMRRRATPSTATAPAIPA